MCFGGLHLNACQAIHSQKNIFSYIKNMFSDSKSQKWLFKTDLQKWLLQTNVTYFLIFLCCGEGVASKDL